MYGDGKLLVVFVGALILVINTLYFHSHLLHFVQTCIVHPLLDSVLLDELVYVHQCLLQTYFQKVDFFSQLQDRVLVNVSLNSA